MTEYSHRVSFLYQFGEAFYLHCMDFYKLTDFQLYSIIHSRHLDKENKAAAVREFDRRGLTDEERQQLANELEERQKKGQSTFMNISPNILYLILAVIALFLLRQCVHQ